MYLQTLIILTTVVLRLNDIRTRFLLLGFIIMLDKSIRKNKTCCRRKILVVLFSHANTRRVRKRESIIVHKVSFILLQPGRIFLEYSREYLRGVIRRQPLLHFRQGFFQPLYREISMHLDHRHGVSHVFYAFEIILVESLKLKDRNL